MKKMCFAIMAVAVFLLSPPGVWCNEVKPVSDYARMVDQLKSGNLKIDYAALRYAYAASSSYNPYAMHQEKREAMMKAMESKDYATVAKQASMLLDSNYTDMEAHFFSHLAGKYLGDNQKQLFHSTVLKGLIGSLYASGDGLKPETAYKVISTDEEYFMLRINGYRVIRQKLELVNGIHYDAMEVENMKNRELSTIYYNVEIPFSWLARKLK